MEEGASIPPSLAPSSVAIDEKMTDSVPEVPVDATMTGETAAAPDTEVSAPAAPTAQPTQPSGVDETEASQPAIVLCGICNENPGKYKCTRCKLPL